MSTVSITDSLYFEVRGAGRPVVLIPGTPGDCGQFEELADILAERYLVVTFDRPGASRSGAATATTVPDQADAAAAVLRSHAPGPAVVFGTSNGAAVALELAVRHPELVARLVVHEPPLLSVLADPQPVGAMLGEVIATGMARGGPAGALDAFLRFAFGDEVVDAWPEELHRRMLGNAASVFDTDLPMFQAYRPDESALAAVTVPVTIAVGADQGAPFFLEAAAWLAERLGVEVTRTPGAHGPQFSCPAAFAESAF